MEADLFSCAPARISSVPSQFSLPQGGEPPGKTVSFMFLGTLSVPLGSETWVVIGGQTLSVALRMLSPKMSELK